MTVSRTFMLAVLMLATLPAWASDRESARVELEANRVKWRAANIHDYEFRLRDEDCFCLFGPDVQTRATISEVFARVERLIETAPEGSFRVLYDASYGFPTLVEFDDPDWEDEQSRLVADGFKPLFNR